MKKNMLRSTREKTADLIGEDGMDALKSFKEDLTNAGKQIVQVAKEVSEDCGDDVLKNAKNYYSGKAQAVKRGIQNSVKAAIEESENEPVPETVREDLADSGQQMKLVMKEVLSDCDNKVIRNAGSFYGEAARSAGNQIENHVEKAKVRAAKRKERRAAARRQRAKLRKKLSGKAMLTVIMLIVVATLLLSGAFWFSKHHRNNKTEKLPESSETIAAAAEPSLLRIEQTAGGSGAQNEIYQNQTERTDIE